MRHFIFILILICFYLVGAAQQALPDSLKIALLEASNDSVKFKVSRVIYTFFEETNRDSALHYAQMRYTVAKKFNRKIEEAYTQGQIAYQQIYLGRFSEALSNLTTAIQIATTCKDGNTWELTPFLTSGKGRQITLSMLNHMYGHLKLQTGSSESLHYFKEGRRIGLEIGNDFRITVGDMVLATNYLMLNQPDSALVYAKEGEQYGTRGAITKYLPYIWSVMGDIYWQKGLDSLALTYYHKSLQNAIPEGNFTVVASVYENLANYYQSKRNADSVLYYASKSLTVVKSLGAVTSVVARDIHIGEVYQNMAAGYSLKNKADSTNKYLKLALVVKDSLTDNKLKRLAAFQRLTLDEQIRLQVEEKKRIEAETKRRMYILFAGIAVAVIIILLIYRNSRQKQKAYNQLEKQKAETDLQKEKADTSLQELKATQAQLIQSEKMASLGELTAGIAHEIQNPLNFVNNFSEVNSELIDEIKQAVQSGNSVEILALADNVKQNLEKINFHGKRADGIVKSMLQHSRTSDQSAKNKKEPTDINVLADEYLRLAYHGLRSKDKTFNATLKTDFDPTIGLIEVIPQDIARAILNLITNAFYAVGERLRAGSPERSLGAVGERMRVENPEHHLRVEDPERSLRAEGPERSLGAEGPERSLGAVHEKDKKKKHPEASGGESFVPTVSVSTRRIGYNIEIRVKDNGPGIPQHVLDKIFQPFFTTKPTGQGTGLGLSLAYDTVKAHGGELKVETEVGKGSEFIIQLSVKGN